MKLKEKLAEKYSAVVRHSGIIFAEDVEKAYIAGFDRAKLHYIDYAKRFLDADTVKLFEQIGDKPEYSDDQQRTRRAD